MFGAAKPASPSVPQADADRFCSSPPPAWKISLSVVVLSLLLALLVGVAVGAIAFIRWRGIW